MDVARTQRWEREGGGGNWVTELIEVWRSEGGSGGLRGEAARHRRPRSDTRTHAFRRRECSCFFCAKAADTGTNKGCSAFLPLLLSGVAFLIAVHIGNGIGDQRVMTNTHTHSHRLFSLTKRVSGFLLLLIVHRSEEKRPIGGLGIRDRPRGSHKGGVEKSTPGVAAHATRSLHPPFVPPTIFQKQARAHSHVVVTTTKSERRKESQ